MSLQTRSPLRMGGANPASGSVNTLEVTMTRGGGQTIAVSGMLSGNPDGGLLLVSGTGGRLNSVMIHGSPGQVNSQSGVPITFWNGTNVVTSGGPFYLSGHGIIAVLNAPTGFSGQMSLAGVQVPVDMPFSSGLQVRAASGAPGFSVSWSPDIPSYPFQ